MIRFIAAGAFVVAACNWCWWLLDKTPGAVGASERRCGAWITDRDGDTIPMWRPRSGGANPRSTMPLLYQPATLRRKDRP
jgi:hypothetical protein